MPSCDVCRSEYQQVAAFCPSCGAPLTALAARLREAGARVLPDPAPDLIQLPDLEAAETQT